MWMVRGGKCGVLLRKANLQYVTVQRLVTKYMNIN